MFNLFKKKNKPSIQRFEVPVTSASEPLCYQLHRSSDFFTVDYDDAYKINVPMKYLHDSPKLRFQIMRKMDPFPDKLVATYPTFRKVDLKRNTEYYLANPINAFTEFGVEFINISLSKER